MRRTTLLVSIAVALPMAAPYVHAQVRDVGIIEKEVGARGQVAGIETE